MQPWRRETFKFSTDPELEAKVRDVVGLYLNPPEKAIVLCVDEKSQIQALNRTAPILPLRPGLPEKATHDYKRNGTTTLFAALEVATGKVTDQCYDRHGKAEFLDFLKKVAKAYPRRELHVVLDNYHTHKHDDINALAGQEPADHAALHPDLGLLAEPRRGVLRDHHPPGDPPRILRQRQATRRRDPPLHRRLERTLPPLHLDQDRRRDPPPRHPSTNFRRATLVLHPQRSSHWSTRRGVCVVDRPPASPGATHIVARSPASFTHDAAQRGLPIRTGRPTRRSGGTPGVRR